MRGILSIDIAERCSCGAEIVIKNTMEALAKKAIDKWRVSHNCPLRPKEKQKWLR